MSEPVTFISLRTEAFRGFQDPRDIDLNASAVILTGANGTGKTSLIDAIQWLLLGRLERLEPLRPHRNDEHIVNSYRLPGPAVVEADIRVAGRILRLRRTGRHDSSLLEIFEGNSTLQGQDAEEHLRSLYVVNPGSSMRSVLLTSALLQQDVMRSLLEASANERYRYLNEVLDLRVVERFEEAAKERLKERETVLAQAEEERRVGMELQDARVGRIETFQARARARPGTDEIWERLMSALAQHQNAIAPPALERSAESLEHFLASIRAARSRLETLLRENEELGDPSDLTSVPTQADVAAARETLNQAVDLVVQREREESAARNLEYAAESAAEAFARLASQAIPLLSEVCPVCGQEIDTEQVANTLRASAADVSSLVELRQSRELAEQRLIAAHQRRDEMKRHFDDLEAKRRAFDITRQRFSAWLERAKSSVEAHDLFVSPTWTSDQPVAEVVDHIAFLVDAIRDVEPEVEATVLVLRSKTEIREIDRIQSEIRQFRETEIQLTERVEKLQRERADAEALVRAARAAGVRVVERRFDLLRPLVTDIYSRLDPHPSFKSLDLDHEVYRARGATKPVVRDPWVGVEANPSLVFSTSQANIAALSYFLALGWAAGEGALPFICLDDPLQSMDDVNVLAFADLCRFIRDDRQLIISTHEKRFGKLLERKLAPRTEGHRTLVITFTGWDRSGPNMSFHEISPQLEAQNYQFVRPA